VAAEQPALALTAASSRSRCYERHPPVASVNGPHSAVTYTSQSTTNAPAVGTVIEEMNMLDPRQKEDRLVQAVMARAWMGHASREPNGWVVEGGVPEAPRDSAVAKLITGESWETLVAFRGRTFEQALGKAGAGRISALCDLVRYFEELLRAWRIAPF